MRGLEPPPSYLDTDLNRARLPIPPHPLGRRAPTIPHRRAGDRGPSQRSAATPAAAPGRWRTALVASGRTRAPLSSRGLGRRPLMAETGVRIPVAVLLLAPSFGAVRVSRPPERKPPPGCASRSVGASNGRKASVVARLADEGSLGLLPPLLGRPWSAVRCSRWPGRLLKPPRSRHFSHSLRTTQRSNGRSAPVTTTLGRRNVTAVQSSGKPRRAEPRQAPTPGSGHQWRGVHWKAC
jgi:hypothetical protein